MCRRIQFDRKQKTYKKTLLTQLKMVCCKTNNCEQRLLSIANILIVFAVEPTLFHPNQTHTHSLSHVSLSVSRCLKGAIIYSCLRLFFSFTLQPHKRPINKWNQDLTSFRARLNHVQITHCTRQCEDELDDQLNCEIVIHKQCVYMWWLDGVFRNLIFFPPQTLTIEKVSANS